MTQVRSGRRGCAWFSLIVGAQACARVALVLCVVVAACSRATGDVDDETAEARVGGSYGSGSGAGESAACLVIQGTSHCALRGSASFRLTPLLLQAWSLLNCGQLPQAALVGDAIAANASRAQVAAALDASAKRLVNVPAQAACPLSAAALLDGDARVLADVGSALFMHGTYLIRRPTHPDIVSLAAALSEAALRREPRLADAALVVGLARTMLVQPNAAAAAYQRFGMLVRPYPRPVEGSPLDPASIQAVRRGLQWQLSRNMDRNFKYGSTVKLEHDAAQFRHLVAKRLLPASFLDVADAYERLQREQEAKKQPAGFAIPEDMPLVHGTYGRNVHVRHTPALSESPLGNWSAAEVMDQFYSSYHGIAVIDDVFSPLAVEELLAYCEESTVWHDDGPGDYTPKPGAAEGESSPQTGGRFVRGYLGAYLHEGFATGLILQIAEELRRRLPDVFKDHSLNQAWAYKYNSTKAGINLHGDDAAVNCNCWITPDDANLDPTSGGMVVYDKEAPAEWSFAEFNSSPDMVNKWLRQQRPPVRTVRVAYRQNRCVLFNSNLFHRTDRLHFRPGLRTRRINLTLLYGVRQPSMSQTDKARYSTEPGAVPAPGRPNGDEGDGLTDSRSSDSESDAVAEVAIGPSGSMHSTAAAPAQA